LMLPEEGLWTFKTALHANRRAVVATAGGWEADFVEQLTRWRAEQKLLPAGALIDQATWERAVTQADAYATPWNGPEPTEVDLKELLPSLQTTAGTTAPAQMVRQRDRPHAVHVLVHHRDSRPIEPGTVRVALLAFDDLGPSPGPITPAWATAVAQLVSGPTVPAGWTPPPGWALADPIGVRHPTSAIDARMPRPVRFDLTLTHPAASPSLWILLAVVASDADPLTAAAIPAGPLEDLIRSNHHFAALRVFAYI
jgi:hypothetical protein